MDLSQKLENFMNSFLVFLSKNDVIQENPQVKESIQHFLKDTLQPKYDSLKKVLDAMYPFDAPFENVDQILSSEKVVFEVKKEIKGSIDLKRALNKTANLEELEYFLTSNQTDLSNQTLIADVQKTTEKLKDLISLKERLSQLTDVKELKNLHVFSDTVLKNISEISKENDSIATIKQYSKLDEFIEDPNISTKVRETLKELNDLQSRLKHCKTINQLADIEEIPKSVRDKVSQFDNKVVQLEKHNRQLADEINALEKRR